MIAAADAVNPQFSQGWLDYAGHARFLTDPARAASPKDKPRVERAVQYVRRNFWDGETFTSIEAAQQAAVRWCRDTAGTRIHGTTCAQPGQLFTADEQPRLLPVPGVYDVPVFKTVKVHRDFHAEVAKALYSLPEQWIATTLDVRADTELVKFYHRGVLVKVHPRQRPGGRSTDPADLPEHKTGYALRDLQQLIATCAVHGPNVGIYAERILDDRLPWTRMRTVYRLLGLVRRYGADRVEAACALSLDLDVVSVNKIASMLERATETSTPALPRAVGHTATRFARDPAEFSSTPTPLTVVPDTDREENR
ncbi:Mu transposase domain-containing protein [Mycobacterium pinniadriaticum]